MWKLWNILMRWIKMIRMLIIMLLEFIDGGKNKPVHSLRKQEVKPMPLLPLRYMLLISIVGLLLLLFIFLFVPGTESGMWYNSQHF